MRETVTSLSNIDIALYHKQLEVFALTFSWSLSFEQFADTCLSIRGFFLNEVS